MTFAQVFDLVNCIPPVFIDGAGIGAEDTRAGVPDKGFTELKPSAYTASASDPILDFHDAPADKSNMAKYLFGGFRHCLYPVQKFQSDSERRLALILDREAEKWFKPPKGQFQLFYKSGAEQLEYQPDFVAKAKSGIYMLEPKARNEVIMRLLTTASLGSMF
jgi:type III restriction enzyme